VVGAESCACDAVHHTPKHGSWLNLVEFEASLWSRDADGAQVEVSDGPNKGLKGFVAKENVN